MQRCYVLQNIDVGNIFMFNGKASLRFDDLSCVNSSDQPTKYKGTITTASNWILAKLAHDRDQPIKIEPGDDLESLYKSFLIYSWKLKPPANIKALHAFWEEIAEIKAESQAKYDELYSSIEEYFKDAGVQGYICTALY